MGKRKSIFVAPAFVEKVAQEAPPAAPVEAAERRAVGGAAPRPAPHPAPASKWERGRKLSVFEVELMEAWMQP